ncbi:MAG: carbohydrate ABC transporter substrate-binding protein, partial [Ruminiclostridium sp.]|nr:carbohydrate ABC transporter substrate-binding protein [Ruminiclostridium sp.]
MKKGIFKTAAAIIAAAMITIFPGCSESKKPEEQTAGFKPQLDTNTACSISVYGNYGNFEPLETEFAAFNEYYPNVELSYTNLDNYNSSIGAALKSSEAPNIYMIWHWMIDKEEYSSLFNAAEDLSDSALGFDLGVIKSGLLYKDEDGKVPMVPIFSTTYGMLVNEDLFAKEGLSVPKTYEELCSVCKALKDKGYKSPIMGYNAANIGSSISYALSYPHFAASLVGDPDTVSRLNALDPAAGEAMRSTLEHLSDFMSLGFIDIDECEKL